MSSFYFGASSPYKKKLNILDKETSRKIIYDLADVFDYQEKEQIDKYIDSEAKKFWIFCTVKHSFPFFFYEPFEAKKYYKSVLPLSTFFKDENNKRKDLTETDLFKNLEKFLLDKSQDDIYCAADFIPLGFLKEHRVIKIKTTDLKDIYKENFSVDKYFFPKDYSWMFAVNHEDNGFLAGSDLFIAEFLQKHPETRSFYQPFECDCASGSCDV